MVTDVQILKFVKSRKYRPMSPDDMADALNVTKARRQSFLEIIGELRLAGELVQLKKKKLADPARVDLIVGTLLCHPRGFGFIRPARKADGDDVYISGENMSSAMHGDIVVARVPPAVREAKSAGERLKVRAKASRRGGLHGDTDVKIIDVLQRARTGIVGTFRREHTVRFVVPDDPKLFRDVVVAAENAGPAKHNDKVRVRITAWPTRHMNPEGEITRVFGPRGQLEAEKLSVISAFSLRDHFPKSVLRAAQHIPKTVRPAEIKDRRDLTRDQVFTIDPEDARDFDDAVSVRRTRDSGWELGVHIADVSAYVKPDDPVDIEARARGTSCYLPGQVLPMLPEVLSNNICSLRPDEVRFTKTASMRFDPNGNLRRTSLFRSFIRSARRFTYKEALAVIQGGKLPGEEPLRNAVLLAHQLARLLRERRSEAGMLELDIPEAHVITDDQGRTRDIELLRSDDAHGLIEQFMLAANEAVAHYLIRKKLPYLCRAHGEPDTKALQDFRDAVRALGHSLPTPGTRQQLQHLLERVKGKPEAHVISYLLLRSMQPAEYSAEDKPHYAIAAQHYLHFTSPIRRYPDLLAHRILDEHWDGRLRKNGRAKHWRDNLPAWTSHATLAERNAEAAERSITLRRMREYIAQKTQPMDALIIAAENYGLRVQLCDSLVEGVVRMSALSGGFYRVDRRGNALCTRSGKEYRVGQTVRVRVRSYDEFKQQIEFEPVKSRPRS